MKNLQSDISGAQSPDSSSMQAAYGKNATIFFGSRTEIGHVRKHNEDSLLVMPPLFAVADGMGGHEAGEVASELAINTLCELAPDHADAQALARAVVAANLDVIKAPEQGIGRIGMGTTLTAAIQEQERLLIAQVGDSRAYLLHQGKLQRLTRDHSLMADMIEAGQLTEKEARVHPNRSVITRAIGSDPRMQPDIYELNIEAGDRVLLCSDGICGMLEDSAIEYSMAHSATPQDCADALVEKALAEGGFDNATAVVFDVEGFRHVREKKAARKSRLLFTGIVLAVIAAFALAGFGVYQYTHNSVFLMEENGVVAVYRGVNDEFFGIPLYSLEQTSDVELASLQPGVANRIKNGMNVNSMKEALELIETYKEETALQTTSPEDKITAINES